MKTFSVENKDEWEGMAFKKHRKIALTDAVRIDGQFTVETREGPLKCNDGYLCIDSHGYPYPVASDEFKKIYAPAD